MEWLKNPWVWGTGAVALVALWYLSGSGSSGSSGSVGYEQANLDLIAQQSQLSASIENAQIAAHTTDTANIAAAITNLASANYGYKLGAQQISAGVQTTQINADTAKYIENAQVKINNRNAISAYNLASVNASQNETIANVQAHTAEDIAHTQAATIQQGQTLGFISNLIPGLGKIFGGR